MMASARPVEQPYRKKSQIYSKTSRGGREQFHEQNQSQARSHIVWRSHTMSYIQWRH